MGQPPQRRAGRDEGTGHGLTTALPTRFGISVIPAVGEPLAGPPDWWVETLAGFVDDGFDTLVFWPVDPSPDQVELFAGDVAPHLRRSG